jgi:hypothetical protein
MIKFRALLCAGLLTACLAALAGCAAEPAAVAPPVPGSASRRLDNNALPTFQPGSMPSPVGTAPAGTPGSASRRMDNTALPQTGIGTVPSTLGTTVEGVPGSASRRQDNNRLP